MPLGDGTGTDYPGSLDTYQTFVNGSSPATDDNTRLDAELIMDILKAVVDGIETTLGPNPKASFADVKTRLDAILPMSAADAFKAPSLTTAQRDALTPSDGWVIWNSTTGQLEVYDAGWVAV